MPPIPLSSPQQTHPSPPRRLAEDLARRERQQDLLARFGMTALKSTDIAALLQVATGLCAEGLGTGLCKALEWSRGPDGEDRLLVRAGVGWQPGVVGRRFVEADLASPAGYALKTGQPVISNDLADEKRFHCPRLLAEHGVKRAINVIIQGEGTPFGVLEVDSREDGRFNAADAAFLQGVANLLGGAIDRARVEAAYHERTEQQTLMLEGIRDHAILMTDPEGRITSWPAGAQEIFQWAPEEILGRDTGILFTPEDRDKAIPQAERSIARETGFARNDGWRVRKDGSLFYAEGSVRPLHDARGTLRGFLKIARDATERRRAEEQLRESEAQFRTLANSIPQLTWMADAGGAIYWYNQRWYDFTGTEPGETEGWNWRIVHHPDHVERATAGFLRSIREGEPWEDTFPLRGRDGSYRWFLSRAVPVRDGAGRILHWLGTNTDVTEQRNAEARVTEVERRLQLALSAARIGAWSWNLDDDRIEADGRLREIFGFAPGEPIRGAQVVDRVHAGDRLRIQEIIETARRERGEYDAEFRVVLPSGETRWAVARGIVTDGRPDRCLTLIGVTWDITDRKRAEDRLRIGEERFRSLVEATAAIVWNTSEKGRFEVPQPGWSDFTGQSFEELKGAGWIAAIHPDDRPHTAEAWRAARAGRTVYKAEHRLRRHDGDYRDMLVRAVPLLDGDGQVQEWVGVHTDITTRRRAEEALRETEERYRLAARATNDAIWDWNLADDRIHWNDAVHTLFGYGEEMSETTGSWWMDHIHPDDQDHVVSGIHAVIDGGGTRWNDEYRFRRADGSYASILDRGFVLRNAAGMPLRMIGAMQDISRRKRVEAELEAARFAAEEANRAKSLFIANMSHELRTPLSAVIGYTEMLEEELADLGVDSMLPDLEKIEANARHLLTLINGVLDISKIEAGKMEVHGEDADVAQLTREVAATVEALVAKKGNRLAVEIAGDPGRMHSDVVKVRQCLFNLLSNAAKFTQGGTVTLAVEREPAGPRRDGDSDSGVAERGTGGMLVFRVADTGIGMTTEQIDRLFERFMQADSSTTRRFGGTGLGLAITKAFAEMLGGGISVDTAPGRGTCFTLRLPADLRRGPVPGPQEGPQDGEPGPVAGDLPPRTEARETVLIIDDEQAMRELLARFLHREGFGVALAADGETGLSIARQIRPRAILLDVMMPRTDGWSVLSMLKAEPELADIPVIIISARREKGLALSLGATDYFTKPVDWQRLHRVLGTLGGPAPGTALVLLDADETRSLLGAELGRDGWMVREAETEAQAFAQLDKATPSVILMDPLMSGMDGFGFLRALGRTPAWSRIPVIVVASQAIGRHETEELRGRVRDIIPVTEDGADGMIEELRDAITRLRSQPGGRDAPAGGPEEKGGTNG
ncbi:PAS domain S-box protein [Azospirillum picis]|uniref:histidine kinase n=1 Tax=Azospirillum picis TaxID=488438 RepID=A0ABU0MRB5_9PROT|nr:PAS domain S-box protein [Azospirillum picis]MBP2302416.1 PAS domain S-box-containing protein [Azospirillum picis]MDQ0535995.1 PAS domain S-box-containing protein [Azospirillum picis]